MEPFKYIYNEIFFSLFTQELKQVYFGFDSSSFINAIFSDGWKEKELKERMRHITLTLGDHLTNNFKKDITILLNLIKQLQEKEIKELSIEFMFIPDFIEVYGIDDYETSMNAMEHVTQFTSCEFAIRPFLIKYPKKGTLQMIKWSSHKHAMVRRLSSEGARPRLPWAMSLPNLKEDPSPILSILERLKNDESESVRRSVANNLNDISKDNPEKVISIAKKWIGKTKETDWVVKHACRTLLKQGNSEVLELFGFGSIKEISINNFEIITPVVKIGGILTFQFEIKNKSKSDTLIRLEYGLYYQKSNGILSKKVFKISEKKYEANSTTVINRKQSFKIITTRKFHIGEHAVSIIINGKEFNKLSFELIN